MTFISIAAELQIGFLLSLDFINNALIKSALSMEAMWRKQYKHVAIYLS
jgi:hypothetical protein